MQNNLPANWPLVKLGDICEFIYGKGLPKRLRVEAGVYPVYGSNGVVGHHDKYIVEKPCLIVGRKGAAGAIHLSNKDCWPIDTTYFIKPNEKYSLKFLFYLLKNLRLNSLDKSTAIPGLNRNDAYSLQIPLPPIKEQHRIVEKIEELFSELDNGIENLKKAKDQIKTYRQAVLKYAFEGKLTNGKSEKAKGKGENGELPEGWKWVKLEKLSELITKGASPRWQGFNYINDESQTLFITSENVKENYLEFKKLKYLEDTFNQKQKRSILKRGDVLFNLVGASIGRAAIYNLNRKSNINQAVALIRLRGDLNTNYLSYFLNSNIAKQKYMMDIADVARANLSLTDTSNILVPLCSIPEQTKIVQEIESRFSVADKMEQSIDESLQKAESLRQSILKQAFEGKLV
ncbi:MAG: hypothetical protein HND52_20630 [Ignavibacteriae bacterium]|nr:hypothetical protein [Ignavibacteriota bacterium]NOH00378.1 hypothetical protein [Ignavibacteriota bacterium]